MKASTQREVTAAYISVGTVAAVHLVVMVTKLDTRGAHLSDAQDASKQGEERPHYGHNEGPLQLVVFTLGAEQHKANEHKDNCNTHTHVHCQCLYGYTVIQCQVLDTVTHLVSDGVLPATKASTTKTMMVVFLEMECTHMYSEMNTIQRSSNISPIVIMACTALYQSTHVHTSRDNTVSYKQ